MQVGASQGATELLKLLELADWEEWHSKFLSYGYKTVEDVELMNEENMKEIGLESRQRFRLKLAKSILTALGPPKCDNTQEVPEQIPVIPSAVLQPEKCSENGCRHVAVSKCRECLAFLCLTHRQTIRKEEKSGDSTIVVEVPACSKCKEEYEKRNEDYGLAKCLCGFFVTLPIALILVLISLN